MSYVPSQLEFQESDVVHLLLESHTLEKLDLGSLRISPHRSSNGLKEALEHRTRPTTLVFRHVQWDKSGWKMLTELPACPSVKLDRLSIFNCNIDVEEACHLAHSLRCNTTMTTVAVSRLPCWKEREQQVVDTAFVELLKRYNHFLTYVRTGYRNKCRSSEVIEVWEARNASGRAWKVGGRLRLVSENVSRNEWVDGLAMIRNDLNCIYRLLLDQPKHIGEN